MIVLVPPSEGKATGGRGTWQASSGAFAAFGPSRDVVVAATTTELGDVGARKRLIGSDGHIAEDAVAAFARLSAGVAPALPAWRRYTGVVWTHLDPATLTPGQRRRVIVPSALLGLVRADDPVPDHRLKLSVRTAATGRLDRWWRPSVTAALAAHGRGPVVDLLPDEHANAIDWTELAAHRKVVRVRFVAAGGAGAAGHDAKAVKGIAARAVVIAGPKALDGFEWRGWTTTKVKNGYEVRAPG